MSLANAADGGIARHLTEGLDAVREQERLGAHACGDEGSLGAGVPATHYDDVELDWVLHLGGFCGGGMIRECFT
jgi:hypothetical protein